MFEPNFKIKLEEERPDYGKFIIEPLDQGFGHTLGNSLRRVLLSSLPGAAVTTIKIEGIKHQFSTIPGLTEDIVEFILNVKKISDEEIVKQEQVEKQAEEKLIQNKIRQLAIEALKAEGVMIKVEK